MTKTMTPAQRSAMFARKNAAKKSAPAVSKAVEATPVVAAVAVAKAPRKPATIVMTVESLEERTGPTAGAFAYAKVSFPTKAGEVKTGRTAMVFGDAYASMKNDLQVGATLTVLAQFNRSINIVGLAA